MNKYKLSWQYPTVNWFKHLSTMCPIELQYLSHNSISQHLASDIICLRLPYFPMFGSVLIAILLNILDNLQLLAQFFISGCCAQPQHNQATSD